MRNIRRTASRRARALVALAAIACVAAPAVAAADHEQIKLTTAGKAAALAPGLKKADLPKEPGWTGGQKKPDLASTISCGNYSPKQSDLVLNGASDALFKHSGLQLESEVDVLATPKMVQLDWQRTVTSPRALQCLRSILAKPGSAKEKFVSFKALALPRIAPFTAAWRVIYDIKQPSAVARVMSDIILVGRGRTEVSLTTTALLASAPTVAPLELQLAAKLAARIRA
jgi:hypothetical protein